MPCIKIVKIPTSLGVSVDFEGSISDAQKWVMENLDTSSRWVIQIEGRSIAEAIVVDLWRVIDADGKAIKKEYNFIPKSVDTTSSWFSSKELAEADYLHYQKSASKRLDEAEAAICKLKRSLGFSIDYAVEGDTHGIHEDYLFIEVSEGGYQYRRTLNH